MSIKFVSETFFKGKIPRDVVSEELKGKGTIA